MILFLLLLNTFFLTNELYSSSKMIPCSNNSNKSFLEKSKILKAMSIGTFMASSLAIPIQLAINTHKAVIEEFSKNDSIKNTLIELIKPVYEDNFIKITEKIIYSLQESNQQSTQNYLRKIWDNKLIITIAIFLTHAFILEKSLPKIEKNLTKKEETKNKKSKINYKKLCLLIALLSKLKMQTASIGIND